MCFKGYPPTVSQTPFFQTNIRFWITWDDLNIQGLLGGLDPLLSPQVWFIPGASPIRGFILCTILSILIMDGLYSMQAVYTALRIFLGRALEDLIKSSKRSLTLHKVQTTVPYSPKSEDSSWESGSPSGPGMPHAIRSGLPSAHGEPGREAICPSLEFIERPEGPLCLQNPGWTQVTAWKVLSKLFSSVSWAIALCDS